MTPSDILYILFKHKWKIIFFSLAGFIAAGVVFKLRPGPLVTQYKSQARLFVRYIEETRGPSKDMSEETQVKRGGGDGVLRNETLILTSLDLAKATAAAVGPELVLGPAAATSPDALNKAGQYIQRNLMTGTSRGSSVLMVAFTHTEPSIVQKVLKQHIQEYLKRHLEIHQGPGLYDEFLTQETDELRARLASTEAKLRRIKEKSGIVSLEETKKLYADQLYSIQSRIMSMETELAEKKAFLAILSGDQPKTEKPIVVQPLISREIVQEHQRLKVQIKQLTLREKGLLVQYREGSSTVQNLRNQIAWQATQVKEIEEKYPELVQVSPEISPDEDPADAPKTPAQRLSEIRGMEIRIGILQQQFEATRTDALAISEVESQIVEFERQISMQERRYRSFSSSLEDARIEDAIGTNRISNISIIQEPSPPTEVTGLLIKIMGGLAGGGLVAGIALAFGLEMFLNQTLRRPSEVEGALALPLFFSIPRLRHSRKGRDNKDHKSTALAVQGVGDGIGPWDRHPDLKPVCESLRDRLIFNFEARDLTRKPKLVGITGCGEDSGVSTIAAGLAASLSETGEGNVLLVDMKPGQNTPHHFRQGSLQLGLDDALELEKRNGAKAGNHLFVVSESGSSKDGPKGMLPTRFTSLVPKMKASDFDYIIFDMPPITYNSVATSLARYMDTTLMVVESEKTNRNTVKKAGEMLAETGVEFAVVLNKNKEYVPKFIQEGLLGGE